MLKHLPNFLSLLRLAAAPLTAWLILEGHDTAALLLFVAAGLSDGLDGFIARRWQFTSRFGAWLDPIADKLLMLFCLLALWQIEVTPWWLLALVVLRDLCIALGLAWSYFFALPLAMEASFLGKVATVVHILYVGICLLLLAFDVEAPRLLFAAAFTAAVFALVSWVGYGAALVRAMRAGRRPA